MLKNKERLFFYLGILLTLAWAVTGYLFLNNWFIGQTLFHIPLVASVYLLFRPQFNFFILSLICWISLVLAKFDIIDLHLYRVFIKFDLFPDMFKLAEWVNPQYTKLMMYYMILPILIVVLLFKKNRTLMRYFVLISATTGVILTSVLHKYIIQDFLYYSKRMNLEKMEIVTNLVNSQKTISPEFINNVCGQFKLECKLDVSNEVLKQTMIDEQLSKLSNSEMADYVNNTAENKSKFWFSGVSVLKKNAEYVIGVVTKNKKNYLMIDKQESIEKIWFFKAIFIKISAIGYFVWCYLLIIVALIHQHYAAIRRQNAGIK